MGQEKRSWECEFLLIAKTWEPVNKFENEFHKSSHTYSAAENSVRIKVEPNIKIKLESTGGQMHSEENKSTDQTVNQVHCSSTASERSVTVELPVLGLDENIAGDPSEVPSISSSTSAKVYSYVCRLCKKTFSQKSLLRSHLATHNICGECGLGCPSKSVLLHHLKSHPNSVLTNSVLTNSVLTNSVTHICCGLGFQNGRDLLHHVKSHPGLMTEICSECGLAFPNRRLLLQHLRSQPGHVCDTCSKVFKTTRMLIHHGRRCVRTKHNIVYSGQTTDMVKSLKQRTVPKKHTHSNEYLLVSKTWESADEFRKKFDCNLWRMHINIEQATALGEGETMDNLAEPGHRLNGIVDSNVSCGRKTSCDGELSTNLDLHDNNNLSHEVMAPALPSDETYKCYLCKEIFSESSLLKSHLLTHCICADCGLVCPNKSVLIDHMKCHTGPVCKICGETFAESKSLVKHYRSHISNPFSCDICHKKFSRKSALIGHEGVHKKGDIYHCVYEHCRWTCTSKDPTSRIRLKSHIKGHPDLGAINRSKNYARKEAAVTTSSQPINNQVHNCTLCPKSFSKIAHLKSHLLTHNMCSDCGLACSSRSMLLYHMKSHPGAKPYQCKHCDESFERWSNLNRHLEFQICQVMSVNVSGFNL